MYGQELMSLETNFTGRIDESSLRKREVDSICTNF